MKILVDAHIFDNSYQGTASYIKGIYSELVNYEDIEITLCANDLNKLRENFQDSRFKFIKLESLSKWTRLSIELPKIIKDNGFDYAHFQYIVPLVKNCKFINTIHDVLFLKFKNYFPWSYRFINGNLFKFSASRSDLILTVSDYSKKDLTKRFKIPAQKIFVTPNAVDIYKGGYIDVKVKYKLRKYILYVSRFEPRKNHKTLLESYLKLKLYDEGYDLVLIGSKNEVIEKKAFDNLHKIIPETLRQHIKFFENISWPELHSFYHHSNCFVFPSLAEGFGIPPIEAALNCTKVVSSNQTAMKDFDFFKYQFDPDINGNLDLALTDALNDLHYPYEEIKKAVLQKYNWVNVAKDYYDVLTNDFNIK